MPPGSIKCDEQKCVEYWIEKCKEQLTFHLSALTTEIAAEDTQVAAASAAADAQVARDSKTLTLNTYQELAGETAVYPGRGRNITYSTLGLVGEAGEIANEAKKIIRDDNGVLTPDRKEKMIAELGDVLWYAAMLAEELGVSLGYVAVANICKLRARKASGTLKGSGGDR
jgi:NTP pyrophosphatase (non-canonical NTP hydrolase)